MKDSTQNLLLPRPIGFASLARPVDSV